MNSFNIYCNNSIKNKDLSIKEKIDNCNKFNSKKKMCMNFKKYSKYKNNKKIYSSYELIKIKNKNKTLIINLEKINNLENFPYIDSHIKYIEDALISLIVSKLEELNKEFKDCDVDIVHMLNDVVDES